MNQQRSSWAGRKLALALAGLTALVAAANAQVLYSDSFSGSGGLLNGVAVPGGTGAGALWSANSCFLNNGTISGANEGSALLPFAPVVNAQYRLTLDVLNSSDRWIALGFAGTGLVSPGANRTNDRYANDNRGNAWMLFRQHLTDATQNIQAFTGLGTTGGALADDNRAINFGVGHQLQVLLDTTGDGTRFTADFLLDGSSVLAAPVTIVRNLSTLQYAGMSYDNSTASLITYDNFQLTLVPEPTSATILGAGLLLIGLRRCRKA
jgi:hypothetical protein